MGERGGDGGALGGRCSWVRVHGASRLTELLGFRLGLYVRCYADKGGVLLAKEE